MTLSVRVRMHRPVVLLHAFPLSHRMWDDQVEALHREGFSPIAPDLPGFGESPLQGHPDIGAFAQAALEALDRLQVARAAWVGLSMGGYVLMRVLAMAPERVAAAVFADTRAEGDAPEALRRRFDQAARVAAEGVGALVEGFLELALGATTRRERPQVAQRVRAIIQANGPAAVVHALHAMARRPDSTELLARLSVPSLVLVGQEDALTPPAVAREMARRIPGCRYVELAGVGHLANLEDPERFNGELLGFLRSLPGPW
ncbi:MAG TPA: alpha/beta fold hydrolase [Limnochordales bacterium]